MSIRAAEKKTIFLCKERWCSMSMLVRQLSDIPHGSMSWFRCGKCHTDLIGRQLCPSCECNVCGYALNEGKCPECSPSSPEDKRYVSTFFCCRPLALAFLPLSLRRCNRVLCMYLCIPHVGTGVASRVKPIRRFFSLFFSLLTLSKKKRTRGMVSFAAT